MNYFYRGVIILKRFRKVLTIVFLVGFTALLGKSTAEALTSTQSAVIFGSEATNEFGHVLYFPNSLSSRLERDSLNRVRDFYREDLFATWTMLTPTEEPVVQSIEGDSFKLILLFRDTNVPDSPQTISSIEDFREKGVDFHFYTTDDGITFDDKTELLMQHAHPEDYYEFPGTFMGYRIEMIKIDTGERLKSDFDAMTNCSINLDLSQMTTEQLTGQVGLASWLDTQSPNNAPTTNRQNIFVIQPTIDGQVNYQELSSSEDSPAWSESTAFEDVWVDLVEHTDSGDIVVASTKTDANGGFSFSNLEGENFTISNTENALSIQVRKDGYTGWIVQDDTPTLKEELEVNVGRLTDIARHSGNYTLAFSRTTWKSPFDELKDEGKNATGNKFILTEDSTTPSTTEPSTTDSSTTDSSTTDSSTTDSSTTDSSSTGSSSTDSSTTDSSTTDSSSTDSSTTDSSTTDSSKMIPGPLGSNDDQPTNGNKGTFQEINSTVSKKNYPITGEQTSPLLIVVGGILLVFSLLLMRQTRKARK